MGIVGFQGGEVVSDLRFLCFQFLSIGCLACKCTAWVRGALRDGKRAPDALEWLWAALWVLGTTPVSSARPVHALNCWDISPVSVRGFGRSPRGWALAQWKALLPLWLMDDFQAPGARGLLHHYVRLPAWISRLKKEEPAGVSANNDLIIRHPGVG